MQKEKFNKRIYKIFLGDQKDHSGARINNYYKKGNWKDLAEKGKKRQKEILQILKNKKVVFMGQDYFMAGMIFQHGMTIEDSKKTIVLAKKGADLGNDQAKWLYAAATDRLLIRQGKKQKFGTQYTKKNNKWRLCPVDRKITDKERVKYNVVPLKEALSKAEVWNKEKINPWEQKRKTTGISSKK